MSQFEQTFVHVDGYQWLKDPSREWLGVTGVAQIVEATYEVVPEADMVIVTFHPEDYDKYTRK